MLSTSKCRLANPTSTGSMVVSLYHPYQILVGQEMICQLDMHVFYGCVIYRIPISAGGLPYRR